MLKLQYHSTNKTKKWSTFTHSKEIIFKPLCSDLVKFYEDETSVTIFYGFLDQEISFNNPAQFISNKIQNKGNDALNDLFGSFIIIHFNKSNHQYLVANDAMGDFAVHYYLLDRRIHISDFPQSILNKKNSQLNHQRILHFFAQSRPQNNGCFFENISQLNPGCCLIIDSNELRVKQYYQPKTSVNYTNISINKLSEQFNSLMQNTIKQQSKGYQRVGVMMSGGMDSTFVVANARKADKQVSTYSYVFPNIPEANESMWIDSMRSSELNMHTFVGENFWPLKPPWHVSLNSPINNPYRHLKSVIYQQAKTQGINTILTGVFADHLYTGYIYWLVDQIKHKPFTAIKSFINISKNKGIITGLRQVSPKKFSSQIKNSAPWMTKDAQAELVKRNINRITNKHPHPQQFDLVYGISTAQSAFLENEHAYQNGVFTRHPFRDRRVVEFLMSLPAWILGDIDNPKRFVRSTANNLLPNKIVNRKKITSLQPLFDKGVLEKELPKVNEILTDSSCLWHNYVKKDLVIKIINNPNNTYKSSELFALWQSINYELWRCRLSATSP